MAGVAARRPAHLPALIPAALTGYFAYAFWLVGLRGPFTVTSAWAPALDLSLSFRFDGLSALFATLITGVGTLIVRIRRGSISRLIRTRADSRSRCLPSWGRCSGVVLSDNVIVLFVFWELTGFTSYLLIGFEHERPEARRAATQALLVTGRRRPRPARCGHPPG